VTGAGAPPGEFRLRAWRNPLHLAVSGSLWRSAWFLLSYLLVAGWLLFAAGLAATVTAVFLAVTIAGIPLLAAAAGVLRSCANAERARLSAVFTQPVRGRYQPVTRPGIVARASTRWKDGATWRDLAYLVGLWAPLTALDLTVFTVWGLFLAGVTAPAWYWIPRSTFPGGQVVHGLQIGYFPNGPHGTGGWGVYVDTFPRALAMAAVCLVAFLIFNYVVVLTARAHALVARALLRAPADPLAAARDVLARPGPLPALTP
jgi:hypothetical protein